MTNLVTLSDVQEYLGLSAGQSDDLLTNIATRVSAAVREYTGQPFEPTEYEEYHDGEGHGCDTIFLRHRPVNSVASLSEGDESVDADDYEVYPDEGMVRRVSGHWPRGKRNLVVNYDAGDAAVPGDIEQAALDWVKAIYDSRGITAASTIQSERTGDYAVTYRDDAASAAAMPGSVREILMLYRRGGHRAV